MNERSDQAPGVSRVNWLFAFAAVLFLALWAWTELRLRAERESARSIEAERGTLESQMRLSEIRDQIQDRRTGLDLPSLEKVIMVPPEEVNRDARGRVYVNHDAGRVFGFFSRLAAPEPGLTYQLWFLPGDDPPESLGLLVVEAEGEAVVTSGRLPDEGVSGDFVVTLEQAGGALMPTGRELLRGELVSSLVEESSEVASGSARSEQ